MSLACTTTRSPALAITRPRAAVVYDAAAVTFAACLLVAAALKWQAPPDGFLPDAARPAQVAVEVCLAAWLASGLARVWARRAALALLALFVAVELHHLGVGRADCGCFGAVKVHPGWTLTFNGIVGVLIYVAGRDLPRRPTRQPSAARVAAAAALVAAFAVAVLPGPTAGSEPVLERQFQVGQPFPLLAHMTPPDRADLAHGRRTILLFDLACQRCQAVNAALPDRSPDVRLIDVSDEPVAPTVADRHRRTGLTAGTLVSVELPLRIDLVDGTVVEVSHPHAPPGADADK